MLSFYKLPTKWTIFDLWWTINTRNQMSTSHLSTFQQYCIFWHVVVTGSWVGLFWFLLILVLLFNIWLIVKWQVHAPVTTTGRKILITQIIAEIRTPVLLVLEKKLEYNHTRPSIITFPIIPPIYISKIYIPLNSFTLDSFL